MSALILSNQITRDEAIIELEKGFYESEYELQTDVNYVKQKLDLTQEEFDLIMNAKQKKHSDYPNNSFFLNRSGFFVKYMRKIFRKL